MKQHSLVDKRRNAEEENALRIDAITERSLCVCNAAGHDKMYKMVLEKIYEPENKVNCMTDS